jgi:cytochrome c5
MERRSRGPALAARGFGGDGATPRPRWCCAVAKQVYKAQCAACHAIGAAGAPKFADAAAWAPRIKTGYDALLNSALKGKGAMTPQSGASSPTLKSRRAVVYMANNGGGKLDEPKAPAAAASAPAAGQRQQVSVDAAHAARPAQEASPSGGLFHGQRKGARLGRGVAAEAGSQNVPASRQSPAPAGCQWPASTACAATPCPCCAPGPGRGRCAKRAGRFVQPGAIAAWRPGRCASVTGHPGGHPRATPRARPPVPRRHAAGRSGRTRRRRSSCA